MSGQTYKSHTVTYDDSIELVATRYLGSAMRWREIAALNNLRAPFISNKPAEWFGPLQATGTLATSIATNDLDLTIVGERAEVLQPSGIFFVDGYDATGQYLYEALPIRSYNPGTGVLTLYSSFRYGWLAGTRWVVFRPQRENDHRVARPGETVMIPIVSGAVGAIFVTNADFIQLYGIDIELLPTRTGGKLVWQDGDLTTVRGRANISQALRMKSDLPHGTNLFHPEEGNRAHELVGGPITPGNLLRAKNYTVAALVRDPRVVGLLAARAVSELDTIAVEVEVELANNPNAVRVDAVILPRG